MLYVNLCKIKTLKQLKGVFKPLKLHFKCGKNHYPVFWAGRIEPIQIVKSDVGWKDKFDSPRFEWSPYFWIHLFGFNLVWYWLPDGCITDQYWEQALWYLYYTNNLSFQASNGESRMDKARNSWPWVDMHGESTWIKEYEV